MTSSSKEQILQIIDLQLSAATSVGDKKPNALIDNPLVFIVQTRDPRPVASIQAMIQPYLKGVEFCVETLRGAESTPFFFVVTISHVSFFDLTGSPFELAYVLESHPDIISVEADLETNFYSWKSGFQDESPKLAKSFCFNSASNDQNPHDQGWALRQISVDKVRASFQRTGAGIKLAQVDTGLAAHNEFNELVIDDGLGLNMYAPEKGAVDPLESRYLDNPGHGTAVASIIISQGGVTSSNTTEPGQVSGVAQGVDYLPIRAMRSVLRLRQSKIAKAVHAAIDSDAHLISMSLGGMPSFALKAALKRAEQANVIALAASGNCAPIVAFPAAYANCLSVSGTTFDKTRWRGASAGSQVDISAPAEFVPHADRDSAADSQPYVRVSRGQGTSFAVALTAGVAALWLEHFGRDALIGSLVKGETLLQRFRTCIKISAQIPTDWPTKKMGAGIVDAHKLLSLDPFEPDLIKLNKAGIKAFSFSDYFVETSYDAALEHYGAEIFYQLMCRHQALNASKGSENLSLDAVPLSSGLSQFLTQRPELDAKIRFFVLNSTETKVE